MTAPDESLQVALLQVTEQLAEANRLHAATMTQLEEFKAQRAADAEQRRQDKLEAAKDRRRNGWTRFLTYVALISITFDLVLSVVIIHDNLVQNCRNTTNSKFFNDEINKVKGQIAGLEVIRANPAAPAAALAGFDMFITASQLYVDKMTALEKRTGHYPFWGC